MKAKIFTLLFGCAMITFGSIAQNFKTFTIDGALTIGSIRNTTPGAVEVVVPNDFDLTKCVVHYTLDAGLELKDPTLLPNDAISDLSSGKTVTVVNPEIAAERVVNIVVKKINPATSLPFSVGFDGVELKTADWTSATVGWAYAGIETGQKAVARYGNGGVSFIIGFPAIPAEGVFAVDYNLWSVGSDFSVKPLSDFKVQASADGLVWRTLANYTATSDPTLTTTSPKPAAPIFSHKLQVGEKYVLWVYSTRDGINVNVDDITVRQGVPTAIKDMEVADVSVYPNPVQGTLHLTSKKEIAKVMLYSLDGQQVMQVNQPSTNGFDVQHLVKGIYLVKVVFADQTVYTTKVTKK